MTNFRIDLDIDGDQRIREAFSDLIDAGDDLTDVFNDIGEYLQDVHKDRWERGVNSEGFAWAELTDETWARKKKTNPLHETDVMLQGGVYQASTNELLFGPTDHQVKGWSLASIHHFGSSKNNLPARELLGINQEDEDEIIMLMTEYLIDAWRD